MKNNQKILIVILIVIIAIGGYFALVKKSKPINQQPAQVPVVTQTNTIAPTPNVNDETANWKTYTNTQYGFEFKYPNDKQLVTDKSNAQIGFVYHQLSCEDTAIACFSYKSDKLPGTNFNGIALSINIAKDDNGMVIKTAQECLNYQARYNDTGTKIINGVSFRWGNSSDGAGGHVGSADDYMAFSNNQCFDIRVVFETISDWSDYDLTQMTPEMGQATSGVFDQILSTFKFTQ